MKIIDQSFEYLTEPDGTQILKNIELAGRVCYKSEDKITDDSALQFTAGIISRGHESVLEHEKITIRFICDRGVTHEIVRHRVASYSQESTRYCNYSSGRFDGEVTFIKPCFWSEDSEQYRVWLECMQNAEENYKRLMELGSKPEEARSILPNSLKTEIVVTMNIRELRHFLKLRTDNAAHPQMRALVRPLLDDLKKRVPVLFDDINYQ